MDFGNTDTLDEILGIEKFDLTAKDVPGKLHTKTPEILNTLFDRWSKTILYDKI